MTDVQRSPNGPEEARIVSSARVWLASPDLYLREAGAQSLSGLTAPDALNLLEQACADREIRVVEGRLRALLASVTSESPEAEAALLRALTRGVNGVWLRGVLEKGGRDSLGALAPDGHNVRKAQFLGANPDLLQSRLRSLQSGAFRQVQAHRSGRLRANPSFVALFDVIRYDPDLSRALKTMLSRRAEFLQPEGGPPRSLEPFWNDIRRMTGLLAGLAADPALTALTEVALDRTMHREAQAIWSQMATRVPYVPELVVGAGPHAANFCRTLAVLRPDCLPLVVDTRERLGGQFAIPEGSGWFLNSRSRPSADNRQSRPGTDQALNAIGAYAPVQEADLTGQSYAPQDRLALAVRLTLFLSCQALLGTRFLRRFPNDAATREKLSLPGETAPQGRYLIELQNIRSGESRYLATDALFLAGGLGESNTAFRDPKSRRTIAQERQRQERRQAARYYTFEAFMAYFNDPTVPFPLRGLTRVIVIGDGDSSRVTVEALLGFGPGRGGVVNSLDRVGEVIWLGQKSLTRERFLVCERPRYHLLAVEFPREGVRSRECYALLSKGAAFTSIRMAKTT